MRYTSILLLVSMFLLGACLDKIDLDVPKGLEDSVVIRGELVKGQPSTLNVYLDRVFNFELESLLPFNARGVFLIDEAGNQVEIPEFGDGFHTYTFFPNDPFQVEIGRKYQLRVSTFDGRVFESALEEIMQLPEKGEMELDLSSITVLDDRGDLEEIPVIQFYINAPVNLKDSEQNARLLWTPEYTFQITDNGSRVCYVTRNLDFDNILLLDGTILETDFATRIPLSNIPLNFELNEGYYYSVYQKSLTKGAFDYWNQTKQIIERTGNLFEAPAGRVTTNFKNIADENDNVFGYFTAYAQDTIRIYVPPGEFTEEGNRRCPPSVPPPPGGGCPVPICCDCASAAGSSIFRPSFW